MSVSRKPRLRVVAAVASLPARRPRLHVASLLPSGRSIAAGLALLALGAAGYALARMTPLFAAEAVDVRGATPAVAAQIRAVLAPVVGDSLVGLDEAAVERRVAALPDVAEARLDRAFPHTLAVTVRLERPIAVVRQAAESWLVSTRGRVLRRLARGDRAALPRVWVGRSVDLSTGGLIARPGAALAVRAVTRVAADPLPGRLKAVRAGDQDISLVLGSGLELRLGGAADLELKLAVARRLLPDLPARDEGGPAYVDLSVPERPVTGVNSQVEG
jgi:cell division protein FtsQ